MRKLKLTKDKAILDKLSRATQAVDDYLAAHPKALTEQQYGELRKLMSVKASALSEATGMKIHSISGDD